MTCRITNVLNKNIVISITVHRPTINIANLRNNNCFRDNDRVPNTCAHYLSASVTQTTPEHRKEYQQGPRVLQAMACPWQTAPYP